MATARMARNLSLLSGAAAASLCWCFGPNFRALVFPPIFLCLLLFFTSFSQPKISHPRLRLLSPFLKPQSFASERPYARW